MPAEYAIWIDHQGDNLSDHLGNRIIFVLDTPPPVPPPLPVFIVRGFTHISTSAHVRFEAYPHFALDPLKTITIGHLSGSLDIASGIDEPVQLHVWKPVKVFRIASDRVTGAVAPGTMLFVTPSGELVPADGGGDNSLVGTITATDGAVSFIAAA